MVSVNNCWILSLVLAAAAPVAAQEVNIYSARQPDLIQPILDAFSNATGIKTNTAFMDKGMIERLQAEGERSPADIVLTVDIANLSALAKAGVLQAVQSTRIETEIPEQYRDPGDLWFGVTTRARVIYASIDRVADGEVTTYEDLIDPKWKGRICTRSGLHNYSIGLLAAYIAHHGAAAAERWAAGLRANLAQRPEGGDRDQAKAIWAGVCDIALGNTYYVGEMLGDPQQAEWAQTLRIVFPVFDGGGTHINISGMAMTKSAPNHDNALKLMEYLVSPAAQALYAELNYEYPLVAGVAQSGLVASWGTFAPDTIALSEIALHRTEALQIMETVDFDG